MYYRVKKIFRMLISGYLLKRNYYVKCLNKANKKVFSSQNDRNIRVVVYTVVIGGYDNLTVPRYINESFDYYVVSDQYINDKFWKYKEIPHEILTYSAVEQARFIKLHPHMLFPEYDYSVFIDGNVSIIKDIKPAIDMMIDECKVLGVHQHQSRDCIYDEAKVVYAQGRAPFFQIIKQMFEYKKRGFPKHYGLFETNVLIRKHNDDLCRKIMTDWWDEIYHHTNRDQLSFTYVLWKNRLESSFVFSLGTNSRNSKYFYVVKHKN